MVDSQPCHTVCALWKDKLESGAYAQAAMCCFCEMQVGQKVQCVACEAWMHPYCAATSPLGGCELTVCCSGSILREVYCPAHAHRLIKQDGCAPQSFLDFIVRQTWEGGSRSMGDRDARDLLQEFNAHTVPRFSSTTIFPFPDLNNFLKDTEERTREVLGKVSWERLRPVYSAKVREISKASGGFTDTVNSLLTRQVDIHIVAEANAELLWQQEKEENEQQLAGIHLLSTSNNNTEGIEHATEAACIPTCCVCGHATDLLVNQLYTCTKCKLSLHQVCGIVNEAERDGWECYTCAQGLFNTSCCLCLQQGMAMWPVHDKNAHIHLLCALSVPNSVELLLTDNTYYVNMREPTDDSLFGTCSLCGGVGGVVAECDWHNCSNKFHVTCAMKQGSMRETQVIDKSLKEAYCYDHRFLSAFPDAWTLLQLKCSTVHECVEKAKNSGNVGMEWEKDNVCSFEGIVQRQVPM